MKLTVRTSLFLKIIAVTVLFTIAGGLANHFFSKDFYMLIKKIKLHSVAKELEVRLEQKAYITIFEIKQIELENNVHVALFDEKLKTVYTSISPSFDFQNRANNAFAISTPSQLTPIITFSLKEINNIDFNKNIKTQPFYKSHNTGQNIDFLEHFWKFKNNYLLRIIIATSNADESTILVYVYILLTALFSILIGGLLVRFFSNWFAAPILELKTITDHISKLDFSHSYTDKRRDEVGELGRSINTLSEKLKHYLTRLEADNNTLKMDIKQEQEAEVSRKKFISSVSHELKTPLAIIQGYAEGLQKNIALNKQKRNEYCAIIIDEISKMDRLIKDLHDLLQFDSGNFNIQCQEVNIYHLTEKIIDKFKPLIKKQAINLKKDISYRGKVYADPIRIEQVFVNYIKNALYHIDGDRILKISVSDQEKNFIRISVYNSGKPIPVYELDNIWTCFYRITENGTRQYEGAGLGLSIVRSIMNFHQTAYGVTNKKRGVEFWFDLRKEKK